MYFMLIALISVLGSGLVGIIGVLVHFLLKQAAAQRDQIERLYGDVMAAIGGQRDHTDTLHGAQRDHTDRLHAEAMAAIAAQRDHTDRLHAEAMAAISQQGTEQREHADKLHREFVAAITALGERMVDLHLQAMAAVAALGERTAALETKAGWR